MTLHTTFRDLSDHHACKGRYRSLARKLGGIRKYGREAPIPLLTILELNGIDDTLWALCAVSEGQKDEATRYARAFMCWNVRNAPLPNGQRLWDLLADERSRNAVEVAELHVVGEATDKELAAASDAACDASDAALAAWAARVYASDAACDASDAALAALAALAAMTAMTATWAASDAALAASDAQADAFKTLLEIGPGEFLKTKGGVCATNRK